MLGTTSVGFAVVVFPPKNQLHLETHAKHFVSQLVYNIVHSKLQPVQRL